MSNVVSGTPRATLGKYTLRFGLVGVEVGMLSLFRDDGLKSHQYRESDMSRIKQPNVSEADGNVVEKDEIVYGYEYGDKIVTLTDGDRRSMSKLSDGTIQLTAYVDADGFDSFIEKSSIIFPQKGNGDAYSILLGALRKNPGKALVGLYVPSRGKSTKVLLIRWSPEHGTIIAHTCTYSAKLNTTDRKIVQGLNDCIIVDDEQVEMAEVIFEGLADEFELDEVRDEYADAIEAAVIQKATGTTGKVPVPIEDQGDTAPDLMNALRETMAQAQKAQKAQKAKTTTKAKSRKKVTA